MPAARQHHDHLHGRSWQDAGQKGLIQKRSLYDGSTHIPMTINCPGAGHRVIDTPVSLMDITTTMIEVAEAKPIRPLDGRSLLSALHGEPLEDRPVISEYHAEAVMRPCFRIRLEPWKYIYVHRSHPQLFNLDDGPDEWINQVGDLDVAAIEAALEHEIIGGAFDLKFIEKDIWDRLAQKQMVKQGLARNGTSGTPG
jgi:choline-sulfatase